MIVGLVVLTVGLAGCRESRVEGGAPGAEAGSADTTRAIATVPAAERTILFIGTSLTAGLGVEPDQAWPALIQRKIDSAGLDYRVVNAGVSGETSAGALRRLDWLMRSPAAVVVIETGANDGLRGQDPDSIKANIQQIVDGIKQRQPQAKILLVGMNTMRNLGRDYVSRFEAIYPELARTNNVPLVPSLLAGVGGIDSLNQPDGIHPTPAGHAIMAATVWRTLQPLLVPAS
jgi:acyl-CoA thioesterase-1